MNSNSDRMSNANMALQGQILNILSAHDASGTSPASVRSATTSEDTKMLDLTMSDTDESSSTSDDENMSLDISLEREFEDRPTTPVEIMQSDDIHTDTDIFAEDSDGESSLDSMSTCYEELDDNGSPFIRVVEHEVEVRMEESSDDVRSDSDISNWSAESDYSDSVTLPHPEEAEAAQDSIPATEAFTSAIAAYETQLNKATTFEELEAVKSEILLHSKNQNLCICLQRGLPIQNLENSKWQLKAAEEAKANLEREIKILNSNIEILQGYEQTAEDKIASAYDRAGI